jgi:hypothetical protein
MTRDVVSRRNDKSCRNDERCRNVESLEMTRDVESCRNGLIFMILEILSSWISLRVLQDDSISSPMRSFESYEIFRVL